ncbi:hypothetical protein [Sulfurovum sp.]|uniref:hypothetical protein n=1 Tax=Sulfurovum sp. TaxID=1969726 RepID=UPI00356B1D8B
MSLLFIGYETEKVDFSRYEKHSLMPESHTQMKPRIVDMGIFAIADSAITTFQGGKTLLTNFRKIYDIEAKVYKPRFAPDGIFQGYDNLYSRHPILVGFAGNTLVAQHILNTISGHLEHLEIGCKERSIGLQEIEYIVNMPCESNDLKSSSFAQWGEDTFLPKDYEGLLTGELLAGFIEHSINHALESAKKHRLNEDEFKQMNTDLFSGIYCPVDREHQIYIFRMKHKLNADGVLVVYTEKEKLPANEIAVLGMKKDFEEEAKRLNYNAIKDDLSSSNVLEDYLLKCIETVSKRGSFEIARPVVHKKLNRYKISKKHID